MDTQQPCAGPGGGEPWRDGWGIKQTGSGLDFPQSQRRQDADVSFKQARPFCLTRSLGMLCGNGLDETEREMLN